jgi:formate/nitrite transporter FocA (FNT family)
MFAHQGISVLEAIRVLSWAALGNIVGGVVFVAVIKYGNAKLLAGDNAVA